MKSLAHGAVFGAALLVIGAASATDYKLEYDRKVKNAQNIGVLGDDLAGDTMDFNTGALTLRATDVSLPTNALTLSLSRRYTSEFDGQVASVAAPPGAEEEEILSTRMMAFGNWDLDIPSIRTVMGKDTGWVLASSTPNSRCSVVGQLNAYGNPSTALPPVITGTQQWPFYPNTYWNGYTLRTGGGDMPLLVASLPNAQRPSTGGPFHWTTTNNWWISCLSGLAGPKDLNNVVRVAGEGFLARSPDGLTYTFNWLSKRIVNSATDFDDKLMTRANPRPAYLFRSEYTMLPTRVEDRFGNWITYTWTNDDFARLDRMDAGHAGSTTPVQTVDVVAYTPEGYIQQVKVTVPNEADRLWNYTYNGDMLTQVTLPDGKKWQYSLGLGGLADDYRPVCNLDPQITDPVERYWGCWGGGDVPNYEVTGYVIHPSGARVDFVAGPSFRIAPNTTNPVTDLGIRSKTVSGPGLTTATWRYDYLPTKESAKAGCRYSTCPPMVRDQVNPDGSVVRRIYSLDAQLLGELSGSLVGNGGGSPALTTSSRFTAQLGIASSFSGAAPVWYSERDVRYVPEGGATFTVRVGVHPLSYAMAPDPTYLSQRRFPIQQQIQRLQNVTFNTLHTDFDAYGRAVGSTESSTGSLGGDNTRYLTRTYYDDTAKWVVGQLRTTGCKTTLDCNGTAGREISRTDYDPGTALPWKTFRYGQQQNEFTYSNGLLSYVKDGRNNLIGLANWEYGIPKRIEFPTATLMTAVPHKLGWVKSVTDEMLSTTNFGYDAVGRLTSITYPTGDPVAWNNLIRTVSVPGAAEYGLPAGHWKQEVSTGTGKTTTFYDARLQPVLVLTEDTADATTRSFVVSRFDSMGRKVFQSYPVGSLTTVDDTTLKGVRTTYDALGRVTRVQQDSEPVDGVSVLNTDTAYLTGFETQVTNPRGFATTTRYQVFAEPSTDSPVRIALPEGVTTVITRQPALGKPESVRREGAYGGATLSATRRYVYDTLERLCETIEPESGTTIVAYDGNDNISWSADGQPTGMDSPGTRTPAQICTDDRGLVPLAERISRTYDEMNRELTRTTTAGTSNITSTYFADGKLKSLVATNPGGNTVTTTYSYNNRRLLTGEILQVNSLTPWTTAYSYNANGHLNTQTYPGNMTIGYAPDGLGRPTQAGTFATQAKYYPNGAMSSFKYGNGIVHTMTQNARLLPANSRDVVKDALGNVTAVILDDSYTYDANGNVLSLLDASNAPATDKRSWGTPDPVANPTKVTQYDGLDRLLKVYNPNWGTPPTGVHNAVYTYDPLDNLRSNRLGASELTYGYNAQNQLASLSYNNGAAQAVTTNARGDITANAYRGQAYQFDLSHRLSEVSGKESYLYDGNGRRARTLNLQTGTIEYFGYSLDGRLMQDWSNRRQVRNGYVYLGNTLVGLYEVNITTGAINPRYKHTDALGSPVVTTDAGKNVMSRMAYTPYGAPTAPMDGVGYTGHFIDVGTQLTYMQQRYYDPQIARFISVDPVQVEANSGLGFARYAYAINNPMRLTDPDGREPKEKCQTAECRREEQAQRLKDTDIFQGLPMPYQNPQEAPKTDVNMASYIEPDAIAKAVDQALAQTSDADKAAGNAGVPLQQAGTQYVYTKVYGWIDLKHLTSAIAMPGGPGVGRLLGDLMEGKQRMAGSSSGGRAEDANAHRIAAFLQMSRYHNRNDPNQRTVGQSVQLFLQTAGAMTQREAQNVLAR